MSVSTQMKDKNGSNHMNDIIEEKEDGTLRPTVDDDAAQHIEVKHVKYFNVTLLFYDRGLCHVETSPLIC